MDLALEKPRLRRLLDHFAEVADPREAWRVAHPLPEVLLLVVCGSIASCDDFDDIAAWGEAHLPFLRRFLPYEHGVPGERWLNILMVDDVVAALALRERGVGKVCIGERRGLKPTGFDFGNSPHEIRSVSFSGDIVIQTTSNGAKGVVAASGAASVYAASLVNAAATVRAILTSGETEVWLIAAGDGRAGPENLDSRISGVSA